MDPWCTVDAVLDFAIDNESASAEFYRSLAEREQQPTLRETLNGLAKVELGHKQKLEAIKKQGTFRSKKANRIKLNIDDYRVEDEPSPDLDVKRALMVAMQREKVAYQLYMDLAEQADDQRIREAFLVLADEEAKHKNHFEVEYNDFLARNELRPQSPQNHEISR
jgi:rubrerythrin